MYFTFPENLPESVLSAHFIFISEAAPQNHLFSQKVKINNKNAVVSIPEEVTHLLAIQFHSFNDGFTYYYPGKGYKLEDGPDLPPLMPPSTGSFYANGIVLQAGVGQPCCEIEEDILPYKGTVIALHEQTKSYHETLQFCKSLPEDGIDTWQLPGILELAMLHNKQEQLNFCLLKQHGSLLQGEEYWCQDNSVADLGIAFDLSLGIPVITDKNEQRQVRLILHF